jgi:hypothetical protein
LLLPAKFSNAVEAALTSEEMHLDSFGLPIEIQDVIEKHTLLASFPPISTFPFHHIGPHNLSVHNHSQ